jgi:hypothetical protein
MGIKQQPLPQLAIGHVKMAISLGPQGTLVMGTKAHPVTAAQYRRRLLCTCVSTIMTN